MSWKKEKKEHPWASTRTAKRIASDHAKKSRKHKPHHTGSGPIETANTDFNKLHNGYKGVASRRVI